VQVATEAVLKMLSGEVGEGTPGSVTLSGIAKRRPDGSPAGLYGALIYVVVSLRCGVARNWRG
jgi:hypothetical protein